MSIAIAAAVWLMTAQAEQAGTTSPGSGSVARLREALGKPALEIPPLPSLPTATFRLTVTETPFPVESVLEVMWRGIAEQPRLPGTIMPGRATSPTPLASADLLQVWGAFSRARHARTARLVKERVAKEHAAFCLVNDCSVVEDGPPVSEGLLVPPGR